MKISLDLFTWAGISEPFDIQLQERIFLHLGIKGKNEKIMLMGKVA